MRLKPSPFGLNKQKRECIENFVRTEPDKTILSFVDLRLEMICKFLANSAVCAIRCDDQIRFVKFTGVLDFAPHLEGDTQACTPVLEYLQQFKTRYTAKAVTA